MGRISETLTLEDRFSSKFMKFISLADRAAGQTSRLQAKIQTAQAEVEALAEAQDKAAVQCRASEAALGKYEKTAESLGQKLNAAQIEFNAMVDEQERMVNAGKRSTKAFATLDARVEKHGTKLRQLKADYAQATRAVESQRKDLEMMPCPHKKPPKLHKKRLRLRKTRACLRTANRFQADWQCACEAASGIRKTAKKYGRYR